MEDQRSGCWDLVYGNMAQHEAHVQELGHQHSPLACWQQQKLVSTVWEQVWTLPQNVVLRTMFGFGHPQPQALVDWPVTT